MICIIALVVFGILGIFSATHRKVAFEAFDCVFRRVTFRPCHSGLDKRLKSEIVGHLMKKTPNVAKFTFKYFEVLSWIFTIIMIGSLVYGVIGWYNYFAYGNCNGENSNDICIYKEIADLGGTFKADPQCENPSCQNEACTCINESECTTKDLGSCNATCYVGQNS